MRNTYAFVLLALGFASGALTATFYGRAHPERSATDIVTRSEQVDSMAEEVGLDPDQRAKVHKISNATHAELAKVRASVASALAGIRSDVRSQMRAVMTEDQRRRFDAYCARRDLQRAHSDE